MRALRIALLLSLGVLTQAGCASELGGRVDGAPEDNLSPEERRLQAVEGKLAQMQRRLDALNTTRFDEDNMRLRDEMRALRGDVEKARYDLQLSDSRSKNLYQDLDRRLQAVEGRGGSSASTPSYGGGGYAPQPIAPPSGGIMQPPPVSGPITVGGVAVISQGSASPEEEGAYLASFDLLKSGKYDEAVRGFKGVLEKWPSGRYADNAAYWMGEANYVKRDYSAALAAFQTVVTNYPSSPKVPDAALKTGLTLVELKQTDQARQTLEQVIQKYPNSNAAKLAQQKLASLNAGSKKP